MNETTGQTVVIVKKEFGEDYQVLLFVQERVEDAQGKKISPDFPTKAKAETFAINWMIKNPEGTN